MPNISDIRTNLKTKLETVDGIGNVFDHVIWTDDWNFIFTNYGDGEGRVHVWFIGLSSSPPAILETGIRTRRYVMNMFGFYSIKTANKSSQAFETVVDRILDELDTDPSIGAQMDHIPPVLVAIDNAIFVQHPSHRAQITPNVTARTSGTDLCGGS